METLYRLLDAFLIDPLTAPVWQVYLMFAVGVFGAIALIALVVWDQLRENRRERDLLEAQERHARQVADSAARVRVEQANALQRRKGVA